MVTGKRKRRLQRPRSRLRVEDLMKVLIDPMFGVTCDRMNLALAFDDSMLACRDRHPWLFDPPAGVGRLRRDARHVALLLDGLWNVGDRLVIQAEKKWKFLFCCHD